MMNKKGVTLIEILVVIAILSIIAIIAVPQYNKWQKKYSIEDDTKTIYGIIQKERTKAFTQKISVYISVNGKILKIIENGVQTETITLKNSFSGGPVNIDTRGTISGSRVYYNGSVQGLNPQYDCVAINDIRVKLGEDNGSSCNVK